LPAVYTEVGNAQAVPAGAIQIAKNWVAMDCVALWAKLDFNQLRVAAA
jgi:hypothetical protein